MFHNRVAKKVLYILLCITTLIYYITCSIEGLQACSALTVTTIISKSVVCHQNAKVTGQTCTGPISV